MGEGGEAARDAAFFLALLADILTDDEGKEDETTANTAVEAGDVLVFFTAVKGLLTELDTNDDADANDADEDADDDEDNAESAEDSLVFFTPADSMLLLVAETLSPKLISPLL